MLQKLCNNKFICPICGSTDFPLLKVGSPFSILSELQVIGAGIREQKCHGCYSSDRDRLVYLYLCDIEKIFDENKKKTILHVAPENCIAKKLMEVHYINYIPIDSFEHGYTYPSYIRKMNLLNLQLKESSIDYILCNHVLQDISEDKKALSEIFRVLKKGGKAILQIPISPILKSILEHKDLLTDGECEIRYGQRFHKRIYNESGYIQRLKEANFSVDVFSISSNYPNNSLNSLEKVFVAKK